MKSHMGSPQSCSETQRTLIKSTCRNWLDCSAAVCKIAFLKTELVLLIFSLRLRSGVECDAAHTGRFLLTVTPFHMQTQIAPSTTLFLHCNSKNVIELKLGVELHVFGLAYKQQTL